MNKFLFLIFLLCSFKSFSKENPSEKIQLLVKWQEPSDTLFLTRLRKDHSLCCKFEFKTQKSDSTVTEIISPSGISLGNVWGPLTPSFLNKILPMIEELSQDLERRKMYPLEYPTYAGPYYYTEIKE